MTVAASLLTPDGENALGGAADWITGLLAGTLTTSLCVIAVACLGFLLLTGQLAIRRGGQVIMGCFVLLGASTFALALRGLGSELAGDNQAPVPLVIERQVRPPLPPANYDPYAGASLRRKDK
ncbi:MAG: TrbC/VirB2 family protein [Candidatus Andeanibacterium colombiense]|uniref:TrbC/VirB2 family protein n=1 Tax=Candidatus Andeanibacterium colombiense TaxID=3121345 RepID=A0AAJ5X6A3_9SPHN|nr:MAG: TrbC/VirB2 family protein [Sphingomonadaceae bacterium]